MDYFNLINGNVERQYLTVSIYVFGHTEEIVLNFKYEHSARERKSKWSVPSIEALTDERNKIKNTILNHWLLTVFGFVNALSY